jgi:hypothetical protein
MEKEKEFWCATTGKSIRQCTLEAHRSSCLNCMQRDVCDEEKRKTKAAEHQKSDPKQQSNPDSAEKKMSTPSDWTTAFEILTNELKDTRKELKETRQEVKQ